MFQKICPSFGIKIERERESKRLRRFITTFALIFSLLLQNLVFLVNPVYAVSSPWAQTNWSGGSGQTSWSDATKFSSATNLTTSTANQLTLTNVDPEKITNTSFDTNLNSWPQGDTSNWWLSGGVSSSNAIAAYQPLGATSISSSYSNLANPGTNDATAGVAPTWAAGTGWSFNGTTQYLQTGVVPSDAWSMIVQFSNANVGGVAGGSYRYVTAESRFYIVPSHSSGNRQYANGTTTSYLRPGASVTAGNMAIAAKNAYLNGSTDGTIPAGSITDTLGGIYIGANNNYGSAMSFFGGSITAYAIYNATLTAPQISAVASAMSSLTGYTVSKDTTTKYSGAASAKIVAGGNVANFTQSVNVGDTSTYNLIAYAYTNGDAVTTNDVALYFDTGTIATTITPTATTGWYKLAGTITGVASAKNYGVQVKAGKTVYLDDFSLKNSSSTSGSGILTSSIFDTGQESSFGALTYEVTTPANTTATVKVRTSDSSSMTGATDFSSCPTISSGQTVGGTTCAANNQRYAQYEVTLANTDSASTPTFTSFSLAFSAIVSYQNVMLAKPTSSSITIMVQTNINTDVTIDYGATASYGSTATSANKTIHEILISGLNASSTYHYRVTAAENGNATNTTSTSDSTFKTQLGTGSSFSFAIISDMQSCNATNTITQVVSSSPDIVITAGDNVAGENATTVSDFANRWKVDFFDYVQNLSNHVAIFATLGNHDDYIANYANGITAYSQEMAMPTSATGSERYYSFDYGDAHFTVLDGTQSGTQYGTIDDTQLTWLQNDLQATTQKYKFVIGHYQIYGWDSGTAYTTFWRYSNYDSLHTILKNNGVLAYINGHRHVYNRFVKDGVTYITNPTAGSNCLLNGSMGNDNYANTGGDTGTIANAVGDYAGFTKVSITPSRASVIVYKNDGTTLASYDLTPENFELNTPTNNSYTNDITPTLSWNASSDNSSGLAKYQLYIDGSLAQDNISSGATSIDAPSALFAGAHTWYLKAVNNAGWSTQSTSTYTINVDTTAPTISSVSSGTTTSTGATITWTTNENASSKVDYGLTNSYGSTTSETDTSTRVTSHSVALSSLTSCTTYHYRVRSKDAALNEKVDSDNTFTTAGCTGSATVNSQNASSITTAAGGSLNLLSGSQGITLTVPASFAGSDANFQIKQLDKTATINTTSAPTGYSTIGSYVYELSALSDVSTKITTFNNALTVSIAYASSDVSGIDESTLKIYRWDGSVWNQLSGCSVNTSAKTVTCTTTNFSTFALFGQASSSGSSSSSSNSSSNSSSVCNDQAPGAKAPWLYGAITQDSGSVLLYFTEADNPVNKYVLEYGTKSGDYPYGVQDMGVNSRGQMTFLVKSLLPNTTYYFKVRGGNGCAVGSWSNEISATTKGLVTTNNLDFVSSELKPATETPPTEKNNNCQTYTVKSGDTLWSVAKNILGDGNKYKEIVDQNKSKYASLETSNSLRTGWELKVNCGQQTPEQKQNTTETTQNGYDVKVKVTDTSNKPVEGAKVTMHSKVQEATTDKNGVALFHNVEQGDHKVLIAYDGYKGEQSLNLAGEVKEFDLNVRVQKDNLQISPLAFGIIGIMGIAIIGLIILLIRSKRKEVK